MKHQKSLFIFRRDLRLEDNTGLMEALRSSAAVIPCFILDPRQVQENSYKSQSSLSFMVQSLLDLERQLAAKAAALYIFEGMPHDVVARLIQQEKIDAVYVNRDYTPFSKKRDEMLLQVCQAGQVSFYSFHDCVLNAPDAVKKDDGGFYTVYTPYCRKAMTIDVTFPQQNAMTNYDQRPIASEDRELFKVLISQLPQDSSYLGGRQQALDILQEIGSFKNYDQERNFPHLQATTKLSAHHKFGTCSIREVYHAIRKKFGPTHTLIRELYWRDFFTQIGYHYPKVLGTSFHQKYEAIVWENNPTFFKAWCEGKTGFPIVDAGMRELNATGFMHNRVRMITASFLIKDLHVDWRMGEQYFAQKLVDYDPLVNNGNWQWAASTGCDAQPYFRIFNPWLQQEKFDPQALYIRKWIPELREVESKDLHRIEKKELTFKGYPSPIVWHEGERARALAAYNI